MYHTITSIHNPEIKEVAKLATPKGRKLQQKFIAEGIRTISTLIEHDIQPLRLYATENSIKTAHSTKALTVDPTNIVLVSDAVMAKISQASTPSGLVAVFAIPPQLPLEKLSSGIVLYDIADPGNAGTLIRTCAAMNQKTVVFVEGVDPYHPKVVQSCAGTLASIEIYQLTWEQLLAHKSRLKLCALVVSGGQTADKINFTDTLLVVGNEAHGIDPQALTTCDAKMTLAMPGNTESLNAAVAGSIALYLAWHSTIE